MNNFFKLFLIIFFLFYNNIFSETIIINNKHKQDSITIQKIDNISYITLNQLNKFIELQSIWFGDRDKIILKIHKHDNIVLTVNNQFIIFNSKLYNIIYPVKLDKDNQLIIPYKTFIKFLDFKYKVLSDTNNSNIVKSIKDSIVDSVNVTIKSNGTIINLYVGYGILFDKSYFNKALNLNIFSLKLDKDKIIPKLKNINGIKKYKIFNFENSSQLTLQFTNRLEKPRIIYKNGVLSIILRNIKKRKITTTKKDIKSKKVVKESTPKHKKSIDLSKKVKKKNNKFILVIDAGHGGKDPGAIGYSGTFEKNVALAVAKKLKKQFKNNKDIKTILTRDKDVFIKLKNRAKIANDANANLFISLHCNSAGTSRKRRAKTKGFSVYFLSQAKTTEARATAMLENEAIKYEDDNKSEIDNDLDFIVTDVIQTKFLEESEYISKLVNKYIEKNTKQKTYGTGIDQAGFYVLKWNFMPAILIEMGFISHPEEEKKLNSSKFQNKIAKSVYQAVLDYKKKYYDNK